MGSLFHGFDPKNPFPILLLIASKMSDIVFIYLTIQELLHAVNARLFPLIVDFNCDYQSWIFVECCREARIAFKTEYDS